MKTILVIDDYPLICDLLEQTFESLIENEQAEVVMAYDEETAWQMIQQYRPDLIFLDIVLEDQQEGYRVLKQIKQNPELNHIIVVLLTARGEQKDIMDSLQAGAVELIKKPFHPSEVLTLTYRLLDIKS